jgi:hypothetical protein
MEIAFTAHAGHWTGVKSRPVLGGPTASVPAPERALIGDGAERTGRPLPSGNADTTTDGEDWGPDRTRLRPPNIGREPLAKLGTHSPRRIYVPEAALPITDDGERTVRPPASRVALRPVLLPASWRRCAPR